MVEWVMMTTDGRMGGDCEYDDGDDEDEDDGNSSINCTHTAESVNDNNHDVNDGGNPGRFRYHSLHTRCNPTNEQQESTTLMLNMMTMRTTTTMMIMMMVMTMKMTMMTMMMLVVVMTTLMLRHDLDLGSAMVASVSHCELRSRAASPICEPGVRQLSGNSSRTAWLARIFATLHNHISGRPIAADCVPAAGRHRP